MITGLKWGYSKLYYFNETKKTALRNYPEFISGVGPQRPISNFFGRKFPCILIYVVFVNFVVLCVVNLTL